MVDVERIYRKLDSLDTRMGEVVATNRELAAHNATIIEQVKKHDTTLYGEKGLVTRMERQEVLSGIRSQVTWLIAGAAATGAVGLAVWAIQLAAKAMGMAS